MRFSYRLAKLFIQLVLKVFWGLKVSGARNLPRTGPVIIASNHISFIDPPVLGSSIHREAFYAAKKELFTNRWSGGVISHFNAFPVRRSGFDSTALKKSIEALESDGVLIMFPEGTRSRSKGMLPFKRGVGYLVEKTGAAVLPAYLAGSNRLKQHLFKPGGIILRFGQPIFGLAEHYTGDDRYEQIAGEIESAVVNLRESGNL